MAKKKASKKKKKEMTEGQAITITVLLIAGGIVAVIYAVQFIFSSLFPSW